MQTLVIDPQQSGISGDMLIASLTDLFQAHKSINNLFKDLISQFKDISATYEVVRSVKKNISGSLLQFDIKKDFEKCNVKDFLTKVERSLKVTPFSQEAISFIHEVIGLIVESESQIHGLEKTQTEKMHFHELNSIDTIIDIVGVAFLVDNHYNWNSPILTLPVSTGSGTLTFSHGEFSLPAPAVSKILEITKYPSFQISTPYEIATVTGIGLLTKLTTNSVLNLPLHKKSKIGIGLGQRNTGNRPNFLRSSLIEHLLHKENDNSHKIEDSLNSDSVVVLETHIDDLSGEILGDLFDSFQLMPEVLDISMYALIMKKNRPGHCIRIICHPKDQGLIIKKLISSTGTLGVRIYPIDRHLVIREVQLKQIEILNKKYNVRVKVAKIDNEIVNIKPEFEDLKQIALETGKSTKQIKNLFDANIK